MSDLSKYLDIEHRDTYSVMVISGEEYIFGGAIEFYQDYNQEPFEQFRRFHFSAELFYDSAPEPTPRKRRQTELGLRRPK
jgi:hypothetical protein